MTTNHASNHDVVAVQVGRVLDRDSNTSPKTTTKDEDKTQIVKNVRSGNARVGRQADTIVGDIVIGQARR